jgi:hypothetical protein
MAFQVGWSANEDDLSPPSSSIIKDSVALFRSGRGTRHIVLLSTDTSVSDLMYDTSFISPSLDTPLGQCPDGIIQQ